MGELGLDGVRPLHRRLSRREQQVAQLLIDGHPRRVIAQQLGLTANAVKWHCMSLTRKIPGDRPLPQRLVLWAMGMGEDYLWRGDL